LTSGLVWVIGSWGRFLYGVRMEKEVSDMGQE